MPLRLFALLSAVVVASVLAPTLDGRPRRAAEIASGKTIYVESDAAFAAAARKLRRSGGRIVLRPQLYRQLVIGPRSWRPLRIVGMRGARVGNVLFDRTQRVSFGGVRIGPIGGDALVEVSGSRHIDLHDLVVSARGSRWSASILVPDSRYVTIRRSTFTHCGDHVRDFVNCVTLYRWSHDVVIEGNYFHDWTGAAGRGRTRR